MIGTKITLAVAAAALMGAALPALADDAPPPFSWNGAYVGAQMGWATGTESDNLRPVDGAGVVIDGDSIALQSLIGGVYAGQNMVMGPIVLGVEADLSLAGLTGSTPFDYNTSSPSQDVTGTMTFMSDWQGSLDARLGFAAGKALLYAVGGVTFAHGNVHVTGNDRDTGAFDLSADGTHVGGEFGGGIEFALNNNLTVRAEAKYTMFRPELYTFKSEFDPTSVSWTQTTISGGITYKF